MFATLDQRCFRAEHPLKNHTTPVVATVSVYSATAGCLTPFVLNIFIRRTGRIPDFADLRNSDGDLLDPEDLVVDLLDDNAGVVANEVRPTHSPSCTQCIVSTCARPALMPSAQ